MANLTGSNGFTMIAGDDKTLEITVKDEAGDVVDLNGATARFGLAREPGEAVLVSKATGGGGVTLTDPDNGVLRVALNGADTRDLAAGRYWHETEITLGGEIATVVQDVMEIRAAVLKEG